MPSPTKPKARPRPKPRNGRQSRGGADKERSSASARRLAELEKKLAAARQRLKATSLELQTAQNELERSSARLRDSEEITRSTLDALKSSRDREKIALAFAEIGTCEFDIKSRLVRASDMSFRLFAIRSDQPDIPYLRLLEAIHPDDRARFDEAIEDCIHGKSNLDIEYRVAYNEDEPRWLRTKGDALLNFEGDSIKILWVTEDVSQRKDMDARVRFLAHHDLLTGLPNRTLFQDRMQQALAAAKRMESRVALLFIDLDRFKYVNDTFGHRAGDILLQTVAARLRSCVRETDTVCRHSGDEYLIVLSALREPAEAALVAGKILATFEEPFLLEDREVQISASVGISIYPEDGQTMEDLVRNADAAMYAAKQLTKPRADASPIGTT